MHGSQPNIVLIVVDDMGYSDIGSFGSEIDTPNLDKLAYKGIRFTNFHATPMCSTTRATLMTGIDHHLAGFGNFLDEIADNQKGKPGYEGYLPSDKRTIATLLSKQGYHTSMVGKWHLGEAVEHGPAAKGFDRSFALMGPGGNHFNNLNFLPKPREVHYLEDGQPAKLPAGSYSSYFFSDKAKIYIDESLAQQRPFFSYLAFTAPHAPLQAPKAVIQKYRGKYDQGYASLRNTRMTRMKKMGLIDNNTKAFSQVPDLTPWNALSTSEQQIEARKMEVYAAMIETIDHSVGELISYLENKNILKKTVIIFLSDNGASGVDPLTKIDFRLWAENNFNNDLDNIGSATSNSFLGPGWANAVSAPLRMFKRYISEGGIRTPAFIWSPIADTHRTINHSFVSINDIFTTILDIANPHAVKAKSFAEAGYLGKSLLQVIRGDIDYIHDDNAVYGWELFGYRAARKGPWKIIHMPEPYGNDSWQLYDLNKDPGELEDLSLQHPKKLQELINYWEQYAIENGVILPNKVYNN
ncbi:arylsulfatase [Dasania marina]|uniref:arylsulfatase n=1 Tax=Dasania marina TaxID=471499 RepID=UPI00047722D2|nr:arylsulfatase [Dasania marina]